MPATIRLTRMGRKKHPFYRLVVLDSRSRRDGDYIEKLGYYNPFVTPYEVKLDHERAIAWLEKGAGMSGTARGLLRGEGVLYRWHLMKSGLALGEIEAKVEEYMTRHGARVDSSRKNESDKHAAQLKKQLDAEKAQLKAKQAQSEDAGQAEEVKAAKAEATEPAAEKAKAAAPEKAEPVAEKTEPAAEKAAAPEKAKPAAEKAEPASPEKSEAPAEDKSEDPS